MKWIARWPGKILKPHDGQELIQLLGSGVINVYDYVFDVSSNEWIRLFQIEEIKDQIISHLGFEPNPNAPEAKSFVKPDFAPPAVLIQHSQAFETGFDDPPFEMEPVSNEFTVSNEELDFQKNLVEQLQTQNEELQLQLYRATHDSKSKEEIEQLHKELEFLKSEAMDREDEVQSLKLDNVSYKNRIQELEEGNEQLNQAVQEKEEKLEEYLKENEKIVGEFKKLAQNNQAMKTRLSEVAAKVDKERKQSAMLKQNVIKLNEGLVLLKRKSERDKIAIQDLERFKKIHDAKEEQELNRLIGDSFEVDNSAVWWIKYESEEKGPYTYADMRSFMKYGKITKTTTSKKTGGNWQELQSHFEFKNDVLCKEEMRDGKKVQRFFIKRGDFRAPFYDLAQIEIGANTYKGYCSSLSVGGCFIELSKLDKLRMEKDGKVLVKIKAGSLSEELNVRAVIKNISDKRPRGLGLQFEALNEAQKDVIIKFVHQYVSSSSKKAA